LRFPFYFSFLLIVGALLPLVVDIVFTAAAIRATITVALVVMLVFGVLGFGLSASSVPFSNW
jgi:hypothetical protein